MTSLPSINLGAARQLYQRSQIPGFLSWWGRELLAVLPAKAQDWLQVAPKILVVVEQQESWEISLEYAGERRHLSSIAKDAQKETVQAELLRCTEEFGEADPYVVLSLDRSEVLRKTLRLPMAAEDKLGAVLSFEMDRQTPFKMDQVCMDYLILQRFPETRMIDVQMYITPRKQLDQALNSFSALDLALDRVDTDAEIAGEALLSKVNLLPAELKKQRNRGRLAVNWLLASLFFALLSFWAWQSLDIRNQRIEALNEEIAGVRADALRVAKLRKKVKEATEAANFLSKKKQDRPVLLEVVRELTEVVPVDAWVQRLQIKGNVVTIQGQSPAATELLQTLGKSKMFSVPSVQGTITIDKKTGKERFNIKMNALFPFEVAQTETPKVSAEPEDLLDQPHPPGPPAVDEENG